MQKSAQNKYPLTMPNTNTNNTPQGNILDVFITFLKLGFTSFGGPAAHIGYFHKTLVEQKKWVSESQFAQLLAVCQFLPGPASSQLGFSLGLIRAGWLGALLAFLAFTLPSALILILFANSLSLFSNDIGIAAIHGLKLVACVVVADALLGMSKNLCPDAPRKGIALVVMALLLAFSSPWAQIGAVILGGIAGVYVCKSVAQQTLTPLPIRYGKKLGMTAFICFLALLLTLPFVSKEHMLPQIADAFYQAGALVFGGGHVVLPLLEESTVGANWVTQETFFVGYGASQAIPGPMFAFSAYLGALTPTQHASWIGASVALIFMFLPGFLLVIAALPLWKRVADNTQASKAIMGVNAAVVGLLGAAFYDPIITSGITSNMDVAVAVIGLGLISVWKLSPLYVVLWCVGAQVLFVL